MKPMKNLLIIILTSITFFTCKAQTIIKPMVDGGNCPPNDSNCYEKDINNDLAKFFGEWRFYGGAIEIVMILQKETQYQIKPNTNFMDLLVGEYSIVINGVEQVITLSAIGDASIRGYDHNLAGRVFRRHLPYYCQDNSSPQELKIQVSMVNPNIEGVKGYLILRHVLENGVDKLEACIYDYSVLGNDTGARIPIPDGNYVFVKQD
jgi:hypothetical protein